MRHILGLLFMLVATATSAQEAEREDFALIGWNNACSVALRHYGYPFLGQAIQNEPIQARIGTLTIAPAEEEAQTTWDIDWTGTTGWNSLEAKRSIDSYQAAGYNNPGFPEIIRPARIGNQPGLLETLLSTETFAMRTTSGWPGSEWRWAQVHYSPLGNCGLFVFVKEVSSQPGYQYLLARIYNPSARTQRARAHVTNGLLLLEEGDINGAEEETGIAAKLAPQRALGHYHHAAMLCLLGRLEEALAELGEAVKRDTKYKTMALQDKNFEALFPSRRFQEMLRQP